MKSLTRTTRRCLLICVAACAFATPAGAISLPGGYLYGLYGHTALMNDASYQVKVVDLKSGRSTAFATPPNGMNAFTQVFEHGTLAGTTWVPDENYASHEELFISSNGVVKTLVSWKYSFDTCRETWHPLAVDAAHGVTALHLTLEPTAKFSECTVDLSGTQLVHFDADGAKKRLYLPDKYKRWIGTYRPAFMELPVHMSGGQLAVANFGSHPRVAVLNLRKRSVQQFAPGGKIAGLDFVDTNSLLVTLHEGSKSRATRFSTAGHVQQKVYAGPDSTIVACGHYTAVARNNVMTVRDSRGKIVYLRHPADRYEDGPSIRCSGAYLYYRFEDEGCSHCGAMPSESKLLELAKLR